MVSVQNGIYHDQERWEEAEASKNGGLGFGDGFRVDEAICNGRKRWLDRNGFYRAPRVITIPHRNTGHSGRFPVPTT